MNEDIVAIARLHIARAIEHIEIGDSDAALLEQAFDGLAEGQSLILETPGLQRLWLMLVLAFWDKVDPDQTYQRLMVEMPGETVHARLAQTAARLLRQLVWEVEAAFRAEARARALRDMAGLLVELGDPDAAYNFAALALDLGGEPGGDRLRSAQLAYDLGVDAGRSHQIAICAVEIARCLAAMSETGEATRLAAFDASERAVELLLRAEGTFQELGSRRLVELMGDRPWLQPVVAPIAHHLIEPSMRPVLQELLGFDRFPDRITRLPQDDLANLGSAILKAFSITQEVDALRLELEPQGPQTEAAIDWIAWVLDHPAYRRAIPHNRSFMREGEFASQLLVLVHEVTHALSMIGWLGAAASILRSAEYMMEARLWACAEQAGVAEEGGERIGLAPIAPGAAMALRDAEASLEITLKLQALQDVWTPWLEGIAVFAESAADPALEESRISPVWEAVRNLVDVNVPTDGLDAKAFKALFERFIGEFEEAASGAMAGTGPDRLFQTVGLTPTGGAYLPGYIAVRAVVSAWRRTLERPMNSAEAFIVLLHATRFGLAPALPDLSLPSERFRQAALEKMSDWAVALARLSRAELEDILIEPERGGKGRSFHWDDGRLKPNTDPAAALARAKRQHEDMIQQAFSGRVDVTEVGAGESFGDDLTAFSVALSRAIANWWASEGGQDTVATAADLASEFRVLGSLLPIGRCDAAFFANFPDGAEFGQLLVQLRTTEKHVETGRPSMNIVGMPISREVFDRIEAIHGRIGAPRLRVTRVVDLAAVLSQELQHIHVLVFQYGDLTFVRTANHMLNEASILGGDGRDLAEIERLLTNRLSPPPVLEAEREIIADGRAGARRIAAWVEGSDGWRFDEDAIAAEPWADRVRRKAEAVLDEDRRDRDRGLAAKGLLRALWHDGEASDRLVDQNFRALAEGPDRKPLIRALFETAKNGATDPWLDDNVGRVAANGLDVFARQAHGWDVRAAL